MLAGLADSPVVLLVGARQTGKSTLIQSAAFQKAKHFKRPEKIKHLETLEKNRTHMNW